MAGETYNAKVLIEQGGERQVVKSGGTVLFQSGANLIKEDGVTETGNKVYVGAEITDISTASSHWTVSPVAGTITKIYSVIDGTTATAAAVLTFEIGGVAVTGGTVTIADASSAGDVDSATPTAANTVTAGQAIECITDGGSTNTVKSKLILEITQS